jgi:hypothetical protein
LSFFGNFDYHGTVSSFAAKQRLLDQIIRLRRVERLLPGNRDLAEVRFQLEDELGGTVSQRLAARCVGVSHTALQHWIDCGDLPTVVTESGRHAIPLGFLLRLVDATQDTDTTSGGRRVVHILEPFFASERAAAESIDPQEVVADLPRQTDRHEIAAKRNLAYHRAIAGILNRRMVDDARHTLWKWVAQDRIDPHYARRWESVLDLPLDELKREIGRVGDDAGDLRQNSPFAGMLGEPLRQKIHAGIIA